jgi:hypothetical protein
MEPYGCVLASVGSGADLNPDLVYRAELDYLFKPEGGRPAI